eukprot:2230278-Prymnesium_polylepis.1
MTSQILFIDHSATPPENCEKTQFAEFLLNRTRTRQGIARMPWALPVCVRVLRVDGTWHADGARVC